MTDDDDDEDGGEGTSSQQEVSKILSPAEYWILKSHNFSSFFYLF